MLLLLSLFACAPSPQGGATDAPGPSGGGPIDGAGPVDMPAAAVFPDALPFAARTRVSPVTLVDERGAPLLVLDALGVQIEVERALADRVLVRCTGCRAEISGWIQRSAVLPAGAGGGGDDALLTWLDTQRDAHPTVDRGVTPEGDGWGAPPWRDEGGYAGEILSIHRVDAGWSLTVERAAEAPPGGGEEGPPTGAGSGAIEGADEEGAQ